MNNILRVLVPVDFSTESEYALQWAQTITRNTVGATIYLMHVVPLSAQPKQLGMAATAYEEELRAIKNRMEQFQRQLPADSLSFLLYETGRISEAVQRVCRAKDMDLVIMTTRGRRGLAHILEGSTTEETIRLAPCPVLVLHLNTKTKKESSEEVVQLR